MTITLHRTRRGAMKDVGEMVQFFKKAGRPDPEKLFQLTRVEFTGKVSAGMCGVRFHEGARDPKPGEVGWMTSGLSKSDYKMCGLKPLPYSLAP